ncbi:MAG: ADP-ribose pyrophosphatase [Dehalococcoidia bacterium]|nr:ADP-ribose pyrophosphatase [Dehalococcoidia bacterium]|tara:strand:- start:160 stop:696 length:537 start_codon:yes stop_codon:yes gene_type:complete
MTDQPELTKTETIFDGRLFKLKLDTLLTREGVKFQREMVYHPGAVCMIPIDADGQLLLVEQYRHGARTRLLEIPAGTLEPGEDPIETAARELREEIGMRAAKIESLGGFWIAPSYATEYLHLYLCSALTRDPLPGDEDEDIEIVRITPMEALSAIDSGLISDAKSIAGILRWDRLQKS